jgi:hypothetical protein
VILISYRILDILGYRFCITILVHFACLLICFVGLFVCFFRGEDCADPIFPGVATRVSFAYDWIRQWVCALDGDKDDTPDYFACDENATFSPAPTPSPMVPTVSAAPSIDLIPILINIHLYVVHGSSDTSLFV